MPISSKVLQSDLMEVEKELRALAEQESPEQSAVDGAKAKHKDLSNRLQCALTAEAEERAKEPPEDGTGAELRRLRRDAHLTDYVSAFIRGEPATGAAKELKDARKIADSREGIGVPWDMFDDPAALVPEVLPPESRAEKRADTAIDLTTGYGVSQDSILRRVFIRTAASFVGVRMISAPVGDMAFPVFQTGGSASVLGKGVKKDAQAVTIPVTSVPPGRVSARYIFNIVDSLRLRGLEDALRDDLMMQIGEEVDHLVFQGTGTSPEPSGFFTALTAPNTPTELATPGEFLGAFAGQVDGRHATTAKNVKMLVSPGLYAAISKHVSANTFEVAASAMMREGGGFMTSGQVPAPASNVGEALMCRGESGAAVLPTWNGGPMLVHDQNTVVDQGQIALTVLVFFGFQIIRSAQFARVAFKLA